jgi:hypothetical protein
MYPVFQAAARLAERRVAGTLPHDGERGELCCNVVHQVKSIENRASKQRQRQAGWLSRAIVYRSSKFASARIAALNGVVSRPFSIKKSGRHVSEGAVEPVGGYRHPPDDSD